MEFTQKLSQKFAEFGISLNAAQCEQLDIYYKMIIQANEQFNLTGITQEDEVIEKHFIDSAALFPYLNKEFKNNPFTMADVGTGAGLPGVVLKILLPSITLTLIDSVSKKVQFLKQVISALKFKNTQALHARAEELAAKSQYRESFDVVASRAVAALNTLSEYCLPLTKTGGSFIAYKSVKAEEEISAAQNAIKILGGKIYSTMQFEIGGQTRSLVAIKKIAKCDKKYPRNGNKPRLQPL